MIIVGERELIPFWEVECAIDDAVRQERETCAKIAEDYITEFGTFSTVGAAIAAKIREREQSK